jgi:hypothetical protein
MAGQNPKSQTMANSTSNPMDGTAWPMLANPIMTGVTLRVPGRVSKMPVVTASTTTITVETAASSMCSITRANRNSVFSMRFSMLSSCWVLTYR